MKYEISKKAKEDLQSIWSYSVITWSVEQADRYLDLIRSEIENLTKFPLSGKDFEFIGNSYRATKIKSHLIFYRIKNRETIEIVRILHEHMDYLDWLDD
jgi:toxin ParE1/3/4